MRLEIPSYPPVAAPEWVGPYIGVPYKLRGRTREEADCWGICWLVLEEVFGIKAPLLEGLVWDGSSTAADRAETGRVVIMRSQEYCDPVPVGEERAGDIVALSIAGNPLHMGLVVAPGLMLHSAEDADSALERYDGMVWRKRVTGFYRVRP